MGTLLTDMGYRLKERRKQLDLTQEEVAERADLTCQTISTAETGKKALRPENIVKICNALGISTEYLLEGKTTSDVSMIVSKISVLSPKQLRRLEDIIDLFISAVTDEKEGTSKN